MRILTTFAGDRVSATCFQAKFILDGTNETGHYPRQESHSYDVMSHWHPADAVETWANKG